MNSTPTITSTTKALRELARTWPENLWVWCADGKLYLMRRGPDGERMMDANGGVDVEYVVESFTIPADGGDW